MIGKRLIYFTSQQVSIYSWKRGELVLEQCFAPGEDGVNAFGEYLSLHDQDLYYLLADLVEEDFSQENIPAVRGKDRKTLLQRKIAQRYRDTTLSMALSLGMETAANRREERILFSSFTNTLQFQTWLAMLQSREARLVGIYSIPLIAPLVGSRLGFRSANYLLVSYAQAGLRQTYVENGKIRFSRLGRVENADPRALAEFAASESGRIQQYLTNLRIIARDAGPLDVLVLAPNRAKMQFAEACRPTANLHFHLLALKDAFTSAGLKAAPEDAEAEALFLHMLALAQPATQFASESLRRFYQIWQAKMALLAAGLAVFAFCALLSALKYVDIHNVQQMVAADRQQEAMASRQYARIQATFPKTPTTSDELKTLVTNYRTLLSQSSTPEPMFVQISKALSAAPQVELERLEWDSFGAIKSGEGAPAAAKSSDIVRAKPTSVQTAQIFGRINAGQSTDYRAITQIVDRFLDELRKQPGIEVVSRRLPFDITAEKSLSGNIGTRQAAEVPRFTIVLNKWTAP